MAKFFVGLINVSFCEDVERCANKGKEGGVEVDGAVSVQGHVHGDKTLEEQVCIYYTTINGGGEYLAGHAMWTELSKTQWRRDFPGITLKGWK